MRVPFGPGNRRIHYSTRSGLLPANPGPVSIGLLLSEYIWQGLRTALLVRRIVKPTAPDFKRTIWPDKIPRLHSFSILKKGNSRMISFFTWEKCNQRETINGKIVKRGWWKSPHPGPNHIFIIVYLYPLFIWFLSSYFSRRLLRWKEML